MTRAKPRCSTTFPRGENDVDLEASVLMNALCKPWELGGHPHDFYVAHRSARITDSTQYYERDVASIKKHERMVAENSVWSRQRAIREEMLQLLTRLHAIEKQRRHFNAVRVKGNEDSHRARLPAASSGVYEHDLNTNLQILSSSFIDHKSLPEYKDSFPPHAAKDHHLTSIEHDEDVPKQVSMSPMRIAERKAVEDLDKFEIQHAPPPTKQKRGVGAPGSGASFPKSKKK